MFKLAAAVLLCSLLAACAGMPGASYQDSMASDTASPPRSPGEGPSVTPYGAAGF
jgi:hypothetical protein